MFGRRNYHRYGVSNAEGHLRVVRDVTVFHGVEHEFVVISEDPEPSGEQLTLERIVDGQVTSMDVSVIDSQPAIVDGTIRHRLRLKSLNGHDRRQTAERAH
jgi:hypothetical protein